MQKETITVSERKDENIVIEKLFRMLVDKMEHPEFPPGGVPVKIAASVYGKAPCFVQEGIRAGWLPIGHMKPGDQKDNFYVSPKKLWEDTGFVYTGQSLDEVDTWRRSVRAKSDGKL